MAVKFNFARLGEPFEADWPVKVSVPVDGGTTTTEEFMARFRLITAEESKEIAETDEDGRELYRRFFVGFAASEKAELTAAVFKQIIDTAYTRRALLDAYQGFQAGIAAKN